MLKKIFYLLFVAAVFSSCTGKAKNGPDDAVVFVSERDGVREIYMMDADGNRQTRLTNDIGKYNYLPQWSPDKRCILFSSDLYADPENEEVVNICMINRDSTGFIKLTDKKCNNVDARWSPDGGKIVFSSNQSGNYKICVMSSIGYGLRTLTDGAGDDRHPAFSPGGARIVFSSNREETNIEQEDGGDEESGEAQAEPEYDPDIPDGKHVLFTNDGLEKIYVMDADGKNVKRLTNDFGIQTNPVWSPDGKTVYYQAGEDGGDMSVYRMDVDGHNKEKFIDGGYGNVSWSRNGKTLLYTVVMDGNYEVISLDAEGSMKSRLTKNISNDFEPCW
jgi:Tol biopolymer transport system component